MNRDSNLLACPKTGQLLLLEPQAKRAVSADGKIIYPIIDGIIDLVTAETEHQHIAASYDLVSVSYDKLLTGANLATRCYNRMVWGLRDSDYIQKLLPLFPEAANQIILDAPVGTGVFTLELYRKLAKSSQIIVLDYSMQMLRKAQERYEQNGLGNIIYVRGDIGRLPFPAAGIDILLTMNGYHAFPEKERALSEMARVLRPGGALLGCFYIRGERAVTDFFIDRVYTRLGSFTPPFYGFQEIKDRWSQYFEFTQYDNVKSILYFAGIKRNQ